MTRRNTRQEKGSMVLYLIAVLGVLGVLAVATTGFFSSSQQATVRSNCPTLARHMAEAGMRYAVSQLRAQANQAALTAMATTLDTTSYTLTDAGTFDLTVSAPYDDGSGNYAVDVSCTGTACTAGGGVTRQLGTTAVTTGVAVAAPSDPSQGDISFDPENGEGIGGFGESGEGGDSPGDSVNIDTENTVIELGNGTYRSYGCAWYKGDQNPCAGGECTFGSGFRARFDIQLSSNANGDGFTFVIANADNNTVDDCGGDPTMGELLAYGGPGDSGEGIEAPKIGLEFDIYKNSGTGKQCNSGTRNDDGESRDHAAWLLWGLDYWSNGCSETYDDNRHGAGYWSGNNPIPPNSTIPTNPVNIGESGAGEDGYYYDENNGDNWMREYNQSNSGKKFQIRIEVDRSTTANADGNYCYALRGWIVRDDVAMPEEFHHLDKNYMDGSDETTWPQVTHSVVLSSSLHQNLDDVIFGWTVATGGATQIVTISDFNLTFKDSGASCPAPSKPTDYVLAVPAYEGQGGNLENTVTGASGYAGDAYWLAGRDCPECASRYFDDDHGPSPLYSNPAAGVTTTGTLAAWVYLKDYKDWAGIVFNGTDEETLSLQFTKKNFKDKGNNIRFNPDRITGQNYRIDDGDKKPLLCITDGGLSYCVNSKFELELDRWYHLAATWDSVADEMQFFVDGALSTSYVTTDIDPGWDLHAVPVNPPWSNTLLIGSQDTNDNYNFQGMIDGVYLYDRVLTDEEIMALYTDGFQFAQE